jgi:protein-disulfide isomerase
MTTVASANLSSARDDALVRPDSWSLGPADASVTIVEFYDPECEACAAFAPIIKRVTKAYEGRVRLVMRYMPLHRNSIRATTFTEVAGEAGKYWQAQEYLFRMQPEWGERHGAPADRQPDVPALFERYAAELGLDPRKLAEAEADGRFRAKIERDRRDGQSLGATRTPTIFVNGRQLTQLSEQALKNAIEEELERES